MTLLGGASGKHAMANELRVTLEVGPKDKKAVAVAPDWPGLERGAKTGEAAIEKLRSYLPRYARVAELAGLAAEFAAYHTMDHAWEMEDKDLTE